MDNDHFKSPIFVLGLPRSGTSMVAGSLKICGAWAGTTVGGSGVENPRGFFEHVVIREKIIKEFLHFLKCDPLGVNLLPPRDLQINNPKLSLILEKVITADGYKNDRPWLYKDAKLTLLWSVFKTAFPKARWVIVQRDRKSIINSCLRTSFMKQHSIDPQFWDGYVSEYRARLSLFKASGADFREIDAPEILGGQFDQLQQLVDWLGLTFDKKKLEAFITPSYWHG